MDVPLFLPPSSFCRSDIIQSSMLRNENKLFSIRENDEIVNFAVTNRTSRLNNGTIIPYVNDLSTPVPEKPKDNVDISNIITEEEHKTLKDLFDRRPIWTLASLKAHIRDPPKRLNAALAGIAFYYTTGPWRCCFVRFGFDPRKDFFSRYYQLIEYRVRQSAGFKLESRSNRPSTVNKMIRVSKQSTSKESVEDSFAARQRKAIFTEDTIPPYRARQYQFVDIHIKSVKDMLQNVNGPLAGAVCNEKRGWLPINFIEDVRNILTNIGQANMKALNMSMEGSVQESVEGQSSASDEDEVRVYENVRGSANFDEEEAAETDEESDGEEQTTDDEEMDMDIDDLDSASTMNLHKLNL